MANNKYSIDDLTIIAQKRHIPEGSVYEMHWHDYIELEVIISGNIEHIFNNEAYEAAKGSAYIITHHDLHAVRAISDVELINIAVDINTIDTSITDSLLCSADKRHCCSFSGKLEKRIYRLCDALLEEQNTADEHSAVMRKSIASQIIIEIIRLSQPQYTTATLVQKVLEYVHLNFKGELSLSILADKLSVTPNYLGRIFTETVGETFNDYINKIRLRCACNMLLYSSLRIKDVALMSGYSSIEYFFAVFKKRFGITPAEYRRTNKKMLSTESISSEIQDLASKNGKLFNARLKLDGDKVVFDFTR